MCFFSLCALITSLSHCYVNLFGQQHTLNLLTVCHGLIHCAFYLLDCSLKLSEDTWPHTNAQAITGSFSTDLSGNDCMTSPVTKGHYENITVYILCTITQLLLTARQQSGEPIICEKVPVLRLWPGSAVGSSGKPRHMTRGSETPGAGHRYRRSDACT